jgi:hypothetical protein
MGKGLQQHFFQRRHTNASRDKKSYSTWLTIREKQIKIMMSYFLSPGRVAIVKKEETTNACW